MGLRDPPLQCSDTAATPQHAHGMYPPLLLLFLLQPASLKPSQICRPTPVKTPQSFRKTCRSTPVTQPVQSITSSKVKMSKFQKVKMSRFPQVKVPSPTPVQVQIPIQPASPRLHRHWSQNHHQSRKFLLRLHVQKECLLRLSPRQKVVLLRL